MNGIPFRRHIREDDFEKRMKELDEKEKQLKREGEIRSREQELGIRRTWKKPAFSKLMMIVIFAICIEIIIYAEWVMVARYDLSALYTLLGIPAAMFGVFWAYTEKSKTENTVGGITYELAMRQQEDIQLENDGSIDEEPEPQDAADEDEGVG